MEKRVTDTYLLCITKTLNYKIEDNEAHEVMIKIDGIFIPIIEVYVDDKLIGKI